MMAENNRQADIAKALVQMFAAAGGILLIVLVITIVIEMGFEQPVPVAVYVVGGLLVVGVFVFYGVNVWTLTKTHEIKVTKTINYRNAELEAMTALSFQQLLQRQQQPLNGECSAEKPILVRTKTLRRRNPQLAPPIQSTALEHEDDSDDDEPLMLPDNLVQFRSDDDGAA